MRLLHRLREPREGISKRSCSPAAQAVELSVSAVLCRRGGKSGGSSMTLAGAASSNGRTSGPRAAPASGEQGRNSRQSLRVLPSPPHEAGNPLAGRVPTTGEHCPSFPLLQFPPFPLSVAGVLLRPGGGTSGKSGSTPAARGLGRGRRGV